MSVILEAGVAIYVAMAVALSVWIGIFAYLWRIDSQAQALRKELERERTQARVAERPAPKSTVTRVKPLPSETVEQ